MSEPTLCCSRCGKKASELDENERLVRDVASLRVYCDWCASELRRICWGD